MKDEELHIANQVELAFKGMKKKEILLASAFVISLVSILLWRTNGKL